MVAHCRKMGRGLTNAWGDIAVIEYNTLSGNTCFFQSPVPGPMQPALTGKVPPPSNPTQTFWQTPSTTASQNCVSCHDSGPFIRDPYLSHLKLDPDAVAKGNVVPGSRTPHIWNETMPYRFVGNDFQSWKTFSIKASASSSTCADCHRMAISARNGLFTPNAGTSGAFALTATLAVGQSKKNPGAPMWMLMDQASVPHNQTTQDEAQVYKTCADSIINGTSTPYACAYSEFGRGDSCTGPLDGGVVNGSISGDDPSFHYSSQTPTGFGPGTAGPGIRGFMYWETLHGPFWQTTPSTVPVGSANYRGSYLRVVVDANGFYAKAAYSDSHGLVEKAAPGGTLKGVAFSEFVTNPVSPSACTLGLAPLTDTDGTHTTSAVLIGSPNMYPETLTGLIGNVAQTVTPRADFLRVFSGSNTVVTQTHALVTSGPLKSGFLQGESYTATCPSWPLTYLARNVLSTNDVVILANPAPKVARCFISGISGSWSSSRVNGSQHSEPYAAIYRDTNGAYHLKVGPDDLGSPPAADRVGAYASCIQL